MGDVETGKDNPEGKPEGKFEKLNRNPFFVFSKPYLDLISKGKIFGLVYIVMAVLNLIIPFAVIFTTVDSGIFGWGPPAKYIFAIILVWLVVIFASWIGFQIWWNRRANIVNISSSEFIATASFSEILQTLGEWLGTLLGILGVGVGLIALIFLGEEANYLFRLIGLGFMSYGAAVIIIGPVAGFFIIVLFRFIAEQLRLFATLVNNTKDIAANLKNKPDGAGNV
ncbi:MAG: hypothetical protein LBI14_09590 [Treponema sp.]|jgi:hypothetical protein|nr:hypothetical protein [Treponema sp.]